ncbi:lysozyme [Pleurocapsales cyanobacterium LEGE 06147]|nr:lysozyme [Pleurocapsales cyanobacterium LEGE 06147]
MNKSCCVFSKYFLGLGLVVFLAIIAEPIAYSQRVLVAEDNEEETREKESYLFALKFLEEPDKYLTIEGTRDMLLEQNILLEEENRQKVPQPSPEENNNEEVPQASTVSPYILTFIKKFEGFKEQAYRDTDGTAVIGYGLPQINGQKVKMGDRITQAQAHAALCDRLENIQQEILSAVEVDLNTNQLAALISLVYNTGSHVLTRSTLINKLNSGDYLGAANEFLRWNKANIGGRLVPLAGLSKRRLVEKQLFLASSNNVLDISENP